MRGCPPLVPESSFGAGSIPASAGLPRLSGLCSPPSRVYPRECGAASFRLHRLSHKRGLSPRVRGCPVLCIHVGNITEVYPRECGAAASTSTLRKASEGLSPRVRGSHRRSPEPRADSRSIPASAGQPVAFLVCLLPRAVYPRECGAARLGSAGHGVQGGLSPRVRGSRCWTPTACASHRSVPASAGQPRGNTRSARANGVYPRECGAA